MRALNIWSDVVRKLTILGFAGTGLWLLVFIILAYANFCELKSLTLNEWGDFLAGLTAPLALFWLIIGYFQQGEELRLNTEALKAQERELQRQVEETKELAKNSARQAHAAEAMAQLTQTEQEREELKMRLEAMPDFIHEGGSTSESKIKTNIKNRGGTAYDISLTHDTPYEINISPTTTWDRDATGSIRIEPKVQGKAIEFPIEMSVKYKDKYKKSHKIRLVYSTANSIDKYDV